MLVSHPHQFIYLKTRKTAGTSVEMAFQPWAAARPEARVREAGHAKISVAGVVGMRLIPEPERTRADRTWLPHLPAADLHEQVGTRIWSRYVKVAVVRNPFDRMVSMFHWRDSLRAERRTGQRAAAAEDFDETRARFRDYVLNVDWRTDEDILTLGGAWCIDVALRHEHLSQDIAAFARQVDIDADQIVLPITKDGKSLRQGHAVADYFDTETEGRVQDRMAWAFDRFGYPTRPAAADDAVWSALNTDRRVPGRTT